MQKRSGRLLAVGLCSLLLCLSLVLFADASIVRFTQKHIDKGTRFLQETFSPITQALAFSTTTKLTEEKLDDIASQYVSKVVKQEIQALRDQFQTSFPKSTDLLPARIIGYIGFVPGISEPKDIVLDRGSKDGVVLESAVVYKNYLIGKVQKVTESRSLVALIGGESFSFTGKMSESETFGIVISKQDELVLDKVLASESLQPSDIVVTGGSQNLLGKGLPPNLLVGKVVDVDKKSSALFQSGKLKRFVDPKTLTRVFIVMP